MSKEEIEIELWNCYDTDMSISKDCIEEILNLIDKLQKELEEYKNLCLKFSEERDKIIKEEMELQKENKKLKQEIKDITSIPEGDEDYE